MVQATKLPVDTSVNATQLAENMFGEGVELVSATYSGDPESKGIYTSGEAVSPGVVPSDSGIILSSGRASDFTHDTGSGDANQGGGFGSDAAGGVDGNSELNEAAGLPTFDGAILEATFIPDGPVLTMQLVFSSDEYPEYANTNFNDAVRIIVNGQVAQLAIGTGEVSIDNITQGGTNVDNEPITPSNENLYLNNSGSDYNTEMDGLTVTLTMKAPVIPGEENTIWIGIADGGDSAFDSNLMIVADSVQTAVIANNDTVQARPNSSVDLDVLANDTGPQGATLYITQINGQDVVAGDSVTLVSGTVVTLNPDGTLSFDTSNSLGEETITYQISNENGTTDTAFVTVDVTCFARGTRIETPRGAVAVEDLRPGDLVLTRDRGAQPLRWVGSSRVDGGTLASTPRLRPIRIRAGALGRHAPAQDLLVSPQHRILVRRRRGPGRCQAAGSSGRHRRGRGLGRGRVFPPAVRPARGSDLERSRDRVALYRPAGPALGRTRRPAGDPGPLSAASGRGLRGRGGAPAVLGTHGPQAGDAAGTAGTRASQLGDRARACVRAGACRASLMLSPRKAPPLGDSSFIAPA